MLKIFMDMIFSESMLDIIGFFVILPILVKLVDFTCNITLLFHVKSLKVQILIKNLKYQIMFLTYLMHFRKAAFSQKHKNQIAIVQHRVIIVSENFK